LDNQEDDNTPKIRSIAGKIVGRIPKQLKIILKEENRNISNLFEFWNPKFILNEEKKLILDVEKELENGNLPIERGGISFIPILKDGERKEIKVNYISIKLNNDWIYHSYINTFGYVIESEEFRDFGSLRFFNKRQRMKTDPSIPKLNERFDYAIEVTIPEEKNETDAHRMGYDQIEKFLDILTFLSNKPFSLFESNISKKSEDYEAIFNIGSINVILEMIEEIYNANLHSNIFKALRWYRWGHSAENEIDKFLHFFIAFEFLMNIDDPPPILQDLEISNILNILKSTKLLENITNQDQKEKFLNRLAFRMKETLSKSRNDLYIEECLKYGITIEKRFLSKCSKIRGKIVHKAFIEGLINDIMDYNHRLENVIKTILQFKIEETGINISYFDVFGDSE
jgi:hypothetical protein